MALLPARLHTVTIPAVVATVLILAAPPAGAGLLDTFRNVRDTVKCQTKAVINPLRVFEWGMKNFENLTGEEYERKADQSMKEALAECRKSAENIVARGFGIKKILDKARDSAARAKSAAATVSRWFEKGETAPNDGRMALAVNKRERRFYEKEAGVLGSKPLPNMDKKNRSNDSDYGYQDRTVDDGGTSDNLWNKYQSEGNQDHPNEVVISHRNDGSSDYGYQDRTVGGGTSENLWNKYRSRGKSNRQNGEAVSRRNDERPNEADAFVNSENEYETGLSAQPMPPSNSGSARPINPDSATPRSQNCEEDLSPICRQVEHTIKMRMAPIEARINAGGLSISQNAELLAEMSKIFLDHAPLCFVTETRPHCVMANQRDLEEMRKTYESALETARQTRVE